MKRSGIDLHSLPAQMVLSFIVLVLLTTMATGLPAIWLIRDQLDRQAWAQVDQGSRAARALYAAWQSEVTGSAILTSQLPSLRNLMAQGERAALPAYLQTLLAGLGLDLVLVCDSNQQAVGQAGKAVPEDVCHDKKPGGFHTMPAESGPRVWLLAAQPVGGEAAGLGKVIVGVAPDKSSQQSHTQSELATLLATDTILG